TKALRENKAYLQRIDQGVDMQQVQDVIEHEGTHEAHSQLPAKQLREAIRMFPATRRRMCKVRIAQILLHAIHPRSCSQWKAIPHSTNQKARCCRETKCQPVCRHGMKVSRVGDLG